MSEKVNRPVRKEEKKDPKMVLLAPNVKRIKGNTAEIFIDPITRIEGHLGLKAEVDVTSRKTTNTWVFATMFRGFEVFMRGRPPEDAIAISSRVCGVCGASHANAATMATDMALGAVPTPLGVVLRNMAFVMTDLLYDHAIILNLLGGPDYSEVAVSKLTPSCWEAAKTTPAEYSAVHGYRTIADIMKDMNPITGRIWQLTVKYQRIAREAGVLIYGRHSHPATLIPGGISTDLSTAQYLFEGYAFRLTQLTAWTKFVVAVWMDLADFYNKNCNYEDEGYTYSKPILYSSGVFDDPEAYSQLGDDYKTIYEKIDEVAKKRAAPPGLYIGGELVTENITEHQRNVVELVDSSFYEEWKDKTTLFTKTDPAGNPLVGGDETLVWYHPWNKTTIPRPTDSSWSGKYSWAATVRLYWKGKLYPFEVGPIAKMYVMAHSNLKGWVEEEGAPVKHGGGKIEVTLPASRNVTDLPKGTWEEVTFTYYAPPKSTTIERVRARAFDMAVDVADAWAFVLRGLYYINSKGMTQASRPWKEPAFSLGFGQLEVPRGNVEHWIVVKNGRIANYQIHAPTTQNVGPRAPKGELARYCANEPWVTKSPEGYCLSPFEAAALHTVVSEEVEPEKWTGLDYVRAIRSFDPCIACAAHIEFVKNKKVLKSVKKLLTNACSIQ
ncbi:nickel-dependent hydrogenase large subunit [Ignicoccus hospitalis]|uniref:Nickel-dependent hydrogenase, large subunit n=1 Tax=Ignicoccus hospitalis (strain KIN4/I / DSM 18386 / JCM 14125) TaxID=453591 RepID=A8AC91_IGNH4|nr:nickel-dependent hydrogenase large subunit [Ignicoccus hospitalis]ABU82543.1 nickel-dependent hydrogenase, large subunit [Ignicoccus hospitalis KIN4/I]